MSITPALSSTWLSEVPEWPRCDMMLEFHWLRHSTGGRGKGGGGGDSSVGRARDSWWVGPEFDSLCGCPIPTGCVGVSIIWPAEAEFMVSQLSLSRVWQHVKLSDVSLGTRPRYSLVVDEDVKKPKKQATGPASYRRLPCRATIFVVRFWLVLQGKKRKNSISLWPLGHPGMVI